VSQSAPCQSGLGNGQPLTGNSQLTTVAAPDRASPQLRGGACASPWDALRANKVRAAAHDPRRRRRRGDRGGGDRGADRRDSARASWKQVESSRPAQLHRLAEWDNTASQISGRSRAAPLGGESAGDRRSRGGRRMLPALPSIQSTAANVDGMLRFPGRSGVREPARQRRDGARLLIRMARVPAGRVPGGP
jgi:hypothetical protein